jgi:hypothetical protein
MKCTICGLENPALCYHPKPGTFPAVTKSKVKYRPLSQTNNRFSWKLIAVSAAVAGVVGLGLLTVAHLRAKAEWEARGNFDDTVVLPPLISQDYHLSSLIDGQYVLDVSTHDGPVLVACGNVSNTPPGTIDPEELKAMLDKGVLVEQGKRQCLKGNYSRGEFFWTVVNTSKDKPVEVTIRFRP